MRRLLKHPACGPASRAVMLSIVLGQLSGFVLAGQKTVRAASTDPADTLAMVNGKPITGDEFLTRFEMSLYPGKDDPTMVEKTKREFLYSMIAERLLARAASRSEFPYTVPENLLKDEMEELFMRDALFRKEIVPASAVTDAELKRGLAMSTYSYLVDAFYFGADTAGARGFCERIHSRNGLSTCRIADSLGVRHDTLAIPYGESSTEIENSFFGHDKGYVSGPTATVDGVVVFSVLQREINPEFVSGSPADRLHRVKQILINKKQTELGNAYIESVMKGVEVNVNYRIFRPLVYAVRRVFEGQKPASYDPYYRLSPSDLVGLARRFNTELKEPLLTFSGGALTLEEVFQRIPTAMFASEDTTLPGITFALHGALRFISQNYFLVQRARELGLRDSWEVRRNVGMILDAFRAYRVAAAVTDTVTVTQKEVDEYFTVHRDKVLKSVRLKLRIAQANNIRDAVDEYSSWSSEKGMAAALNDTSVHWVSAYDLGETGALLSRLREGDIFGPVEANGKFLTYQLIEKKSSVSGAVIKNSIGAAREMLLAKARREALSRYIAGLAEGENVRIFGENILTLKVTPFQMLTYRLIGFGGRVLAVPALYPREEWIKYFREARRAPQP